MSKLRLTDQGDEEGPPRPRDESDARSPAGRLLIALVLCIMLAVGCWVVAPLLGVYMPPIVPILGFTVIAGGVVLGMWESEGRGPPEDRGGPDPW